MEVIITRNVNQALPEALYRMEKKGVTRESRNGPVTMFPHPVVTVYTHPEERVMFWGERDCNPFFHMMESLWMLGGRNDVDYVAHYVSRMRTFSDDGETLHGAYGHRWRKHFGYDQLPKIIAALQNNHDDRRQVLSMWDANVDLGRNGKDLPCNLQCIFQVNHEGALDMTVTNRSNDIIWGAYGANAVHFSMLHEFIARAAKLPTGRYYQFSTNFHVYNEVWKKVERLSMEAPDGMDGGGAPCPYARGDVHPFPIMSTDLNDWQDELLIFLEHGPVVGFRDPFFKKVVFPMYSAYNIYRNGKHVSRYDDAIEAMDLCRAQDWKKACVEWLQRRKAAYLRANDDGVNYE